MCTNECAFTARESARASLIRMCDTGARFAFAHACCSRVKRSRTREYAVYAGAIKFPAFIYNVSANRVTFLPTDVASRDSPTVNTALYTRALGCRAGNSARETAEIIAVDT